MNQAAAALLGAVIGSLSGLLGSYLTGRRQERVQQEKWRHARDDTINNETRIALAELTRTLAALSHSIMWATYQALLTNNVSPTAVQAYETELHKAIAGAVSMQMNIAALNSSLYERVTPFVSEIIRLGSDSFEALVGAETDFDAGQEKLLGCNQRSLTFIKNLPAQFAEMLRHI